MAEVYKNIINNLRKGLIDQCELNSLGNGFEQLFKRIEALEIESHKNDEQKAEMQSHIDCLKAELAEIQMNKQEVDTELKAERKKNHYLNHVVEDLNDISRRLRNENEKLQATETQKHKPEPAAKSFEIKIDSLKIPIQKASVLIRDTQDKYQEVYGMNDGFSMAISDLKQIAEHLLVYCNHAEVE